MTNPPPITREWADWLRAGRSLPFNAPPWVRLYRYDRRGDAVVPKRGYVWHCPVRLHPTDRTLSDEDWQRIAERLMRATGIHQAGCRWIAVRHAEDHIHLAATLVSEDTGKRFHPSHDHYKLRAECRTLEREYGLVATAPADRTALRAPTRAEQGKSARLRRPETAREHLRRVVAQTAAAVHDATLFVARLAEEGIRVRLARDQDDRVSGYAVALPGDLTAQGRPVWYSGSKLGRDLTWPKLAQRWTDMPTPASKPSEATTTGHVRDGAADVDGLGPFTVGAERLTPAERRMILQDATDAVQRATVSVRAGHDVEGTAHAAGEILVLVARGHEGRDPGPLGTASDRYDRAARTPYRVLPRNLGPIAAELRRASRQIVRIGMFARHGKEKFATLALLLALAGLITEIAAWQQTHDRTHQAAAARSAAGALPALTTPAGTERPAVTRPARSIVPPAPGGTRRDRLYVRRVVPGQGHPRPRGRGPGG